MKVWPEIDKTSKKSKILRRKIVNENGDEESEEYEVDASDSENESNLRKGKVICECN